ncbi:unnamed protein product, partial [Rotaria magnacalcarata]
MEEGPLYFYYRNQPFGEFSNFYPSPIELDGYTWSTTEHYFQAQKFISDETHFQNVLHLRKPIEALFYSRKHRSAVRSDWAQVKDGIMLKACMAKFEQHFRLQELLLSTGNRQLVEHTTKDSYWADGGDASSVSFVSVHLRPRNFQWYWNSAADPWSDCEEEEWKKYTDVENEIIEDAYNANNTSVEIDGDYMINLKHQFQYKKNHSTRQCRIKRVQLNTDRSNVYFREERFSLPVVSTSESSPDMAADGIIREGKRLNKPIEAEWLSSQLITVKPFGANLDARQSAHIRIPSEISQTCVYLYTKESFWYTLFNYTLREVIVPTCEQLKTFGPFSWLLYCSLCQIKTTKDILTVYRGLNLTDEQRQEFMEDHVVFFAFTSTSTNRVKAEAFGNTLLIIDLNVQHPYYPDQNIWCGSDIAALSVFPGEEEFLLKN